MSGFRWWRLPSAHRQNRRSNKTILSAFIEEISGNASIGTVKKLYAPKNKSPHAQMITIKRCRSENSIMLVSIFVT